MALALAGRLNVIVASGPSNSKIGWFSKEGFGMALPLVAQDGSVAYHMLADHEGSRVRVLAYHSPAQYNGATRRAACRCMSLLVVEQCRSTMSHLVVEQCRSTMSHIGLTNHE